MLEIKNKIFRVGINYVGGELEYLYIKNINILWTKSKEIWNYQAPILFPIVGALKEDYYIYNNNKYQLNRHGFARNSIFKLETIKEDEVVLSLMYNEQTLKIYPFKFKLLLGYKLINNSLEVSLKIINLDSIEIPFNIGFHPGFMIEGLNKLVGEKLKYSFNYSKIKNISFSSRYVNSKTEINEITFYDNDTLNDELFENNTICIEGINRIDIYDKKRLILEHNMLYTGFWHANDDFICIEPWDGLPDYDNKISRDIFNKSGIKILKPNNVFNTKILIKFEE